jgi:hypothetical protein
MNEKALQNLDLTQITELSFAQNDNGEIITEVFSTPKMVPQGDGVAPSFIVAGLEIRLSNSDEVEVHNLYKDDIAHNAYIIYLNYQEHRDGTYEYDGIRALIFEQDNLSPNDEDAKHTYDFSTLRDALLFLKENYKSLADRPSPFSNTSSRIKDPLSAVFSRKQ